MSKKTPSRFGKIVSKLTKAANKAVKTKESFKAFRQESTEKYVEIPHLNSNYARMI